MPTDWNIAGPGEASGSDPNRFTNSKHIGDHVLFIGITPGEATSRPDSSGKTTTYQVANCSAVVCLSCEHAYAEQQVSGKALVPKLSSAGSDIVLVRLIEGEKGQFDNAPILGVEPEPDQVEAARLVLDTYAHRMPSGAVLFDTAGFNGKPSESF